MNQCRPVIIGIHGLGHKPSPPLLARWWEKAIREGLSRLLDRTRRF